MTDDINFNGSYFHTLVCAALHHYESSIDDATRLDGKHSIIGKLSSQAG
jgi:hypothetical protein